MDTVADRIKKALEIRNMKQADLVEKTAIGKSSISTYISGAYEPKQRNIYKLAKALDVNEAWLMGHDVPMERKNYEIGSELKKILVKISQDENIPIELLKDVFLGNTELIKMAPIDGGTDINYENLLKATREAFNARRTLYDELDKETNNNEDPIIIRRIRKITDKMDDKQQDKMMKILKASFEELFEDGNE